MKLNTGNIKILDKKLVLFIDKAWFYINKFHIHKIYFCSESQEQNPFLLNAYRQSWYPFKCKMGYIFLPRHLWYKSYGWYFILINFGLLSKLLWGRKACWIWIEKLSVFSHNISIFNLLFKQQFVVVFFLRDDWANSIPSSLSVHSEIAT